MGCFAIKNMFLAKPLFVSKVAFTLRDIGNKNLYSFKKILQNEDIISPIFEDVSNSSLLIKFTPLIPEDLINIDFLLPPKSTWITPRL